MYLALSHKNQNSDVGLRRIYIFRYPYKLLVRLTQPTNLKLTIFSPLFPSPHATCFKSAAVATTEGTSVHAALPWEPAQRSGSSPPSFSSPNSQPQYH